MTDHTGPEGVQESLFELGHDDAEVGYRVPTAIQAAGITYRQLDYWARTGLVEPSIRDAHGSGSQRLYSFRDILVLKIVRGLLDTGISLQNIRLAVDRLSDLGVDDLATITLVSDGRTVYQCRSNEEVIDLLNGGQGVFGIAVPGILRELAGDIVKFPSERIDGTPQVETIDELAERRNRRSS
ncbi:MerR family transcriptional regulator [Corynebacterium sputi]|uniref:MerR family transcriptional regulator n=1 Tax=Corynebacterium sputi TaxID=489915 RepID=UPI0004287F25|nr:MerR family transcriptional regulator [Corynebacterium sputi]